MRYEVGICIQTGWIVWINGPYPCGEWPDLRIARESIIYELDDNEFFLADGGYHDRNQYSVTPTGGNQFSDRQKAVARARHESINKSLKSFDILKQKFRHPLDKHNTVFNSVANVTQLRIMNGDFIFNVDYNEAEF